MKIIQFLHPGGEQNEKHGSDWNLGKHQRKFIRSIGSMLDSELNKTEETLGFWGEWEAPSIYTETGNKIEGLPKYFTDPYYYMSDVLRNSDPFVFGSQFYYSICQQGHSTQLRELKLGDIILFGSSVDDKFVLDTLLVVDDSFPYHLHNLNKLKSKVNDVFYDVTLQPIMKSKSIGSKPELIEKNGLHEVTNSDYDEITKCITDEKDQYRVYKGLMHKDKERFENIFSFVPAVSLDKHQNGFARPNIVLDNIITQNHRQGLKITKHSPEKGIELWHDITKQVLEQGLGLMVECELPEKR